MTTEIVSGEDDNWRSLRTITEKLRWILIYEFPTVLRIYDISNTSANMVLDKLLDKDNNLETFHIRLDFGICQVDAYQLSIFLLLIYT